MVRPTDPGFEEYLERKRRREGGVPPPPTVAPTLEETTDLGFEGYLERKRRRTEPKSLEGASAPPPAVVEPLSRPAAVEAMPRELFPDAIPLVASAPGAAERASLPPTAAPRTHPKVVLTVEEQRQRARERRAAGSPHVIGPALAKVD